MLQLQVSVQVILTESGSFMADTVKEQTFVGGTTFVESKGVVIEITLEPREACPQILNLFLGEQAI